MTSLAPHLLAAMKADYQSGARSVGEIAAYYRISEGTVYRHRKRGGWTKRQSALPAIPLTVPELEPDPPEGAPEAACRNRLAPRLVKLLERAVAEIEVAAAEPPEGLTSMDRARDVRTLTTVVRLLHELEHGPADSENPNPEDQSEDNEDLLRQEIAHRLDRLKDAGRTL